MSTNSLKDTIATLWAAITVSDKAKDAKYVAAHPEEFGFSWGSGALGRGTGAQYVELRKDFPHIEPAEGLEGILLLTKSFGPAVISKGLRGTSWKVSCDRINRDSHEDNRSITNDELKVKIVNSVLLGVVTKGFATTKYVVGGQTFASATDAEKFAANQARIKDLEAATAFLAMASDNGIDAVVARNMAKVQYPLAFAPTQEEVADEDEKHEGDEN